MTVVSHRVRNFSVCCSVVVNPVRSPREALNEKVEEDELRLLCV